MRKLPLALPLLLAAALAAKADSTPHWLELRTPHFVVLSDGSERQIKHTAAQLEEMHGVFQKLLPNARADTDAPIIVLALRDKKGFQTLEPAAYLAKNSLTLDGFFVRVPDKNYILIRLDAEGEHPFDVIYHEYTHLMYSKADWIPLWLNEGLAEFYQNTDIMEKQVRIGQASGDNILYLRQNRLLPLATILAVDHASPYYHDEQKGSVFYAESWALTHFLIVTDRENHTHRLNDYMLRVSKHEDPVTAAQQAWGDLNTLQRQLDQYIQGADFKMFLMTTGFTFDESQLHPEPLATTEANAIRADVLVSTNRPEDAKALDEAVLREDPKNEQAHETMGTMSMRAGDVAAAKKWYGEAVKLDSKSYLAHYYYAVMSMQAGDTDDAAIEASFHESIKLNPNFAPAYDALAHFYLIHNKDLDEAHVFSIHAVQLEPENLNYRLNGVSVLMRQGNTESALSVLREAKRVAKSPSDFARIDQQIAQVENFRRYSNSTTTQGDPNVTVSSPAGGTDPRAVTAKEPEPFPEPTASAPHHTAKGVVHSVHCSYPTVMTLDLEQAGKDQAGRTLALYSNNYYKITFSTANYPPPDNMDPCKVIEGMKASIQFSEVKDPRVAGQILAIELSK